MNCPEHLVFGKRGIWVWLYWHDVPRRLIPLSVWLNPLRYQVSYVRNGRQVFILNREGQCWGRMRRFFICKWRALFGERHG